MVHSCEGNGITFVRSVAGQQQGRKGENVNTPDLTDKKEEEEEGFSLLPFRHCCYRGSQINSKSSRGRPPPPPNQMFSKLLQKPQNTFCVIFGHLWKFYFFPAKKVKKGVFFDAIYSKTRPL